MSTFNGIVSEFPDIRIDFFRRHANVEPPLACFLSHVHSDHLAGLDSLKSSFVYCSAGTREILLRLERYPCRINYAKGILEARQQTYRHLAKLLKPLPLITPTIIELHPGRDIQVTLFDANHCVGAVMFLIEGDGKAILYTGDIRSEPWFVNSLARNPSLLEYTSGIKTLDKIYLDTSFIENIPFQTKAEGIAELLREVAKYPADTVFHVQAWTYGYEDVWVALSKALKSRIHVDDYKLRIYGSLKRRASSKRFAADFHLTPESPALTGYMCGNAPHPGCLTRNSNVRLHSCEKGSMCDVAKKPSTVVIQPVIAHLPMGEDLAEIGVGGGGDDLEREAELDYLNPSDIDALMELIYSSGHLKNDDADTVKRCLLQKTATGRNISLDIDITSLDENQSHQDAVRMLVEKLYSISKRDAAEAGVRRDNLPKRIRFPYSRHSSYPELCDLVKIFRPRDVWPCTVNPTEWLRGGITIESLFGELCSADRFEHDREMEAISHLHFKGLSAHSDTQASTDSAPRIKSSPMNSPIQSFSRGVEVARASIQDYSTGSQLVAESIFMERLVSPLPATQRTTQSLASGGDPDDLGSSISGSRRVYHGLLDQSSTPSRKRGAAEISGERSNNMESGNSQGTEESVTSTLLPRHSLARRDAFFQMLDNVAADTWGPIGLVSTSSEYTTLENEL